MARPTLHIAFLHLAPVPGDLVHNRRAIETAIVRAAQQGTTWIITPELAICGYTLFANTLGTTGSNRNLISGCQACADSWLSFITLFLSHPERDSKTDTLYNSLFVITADKVVLSAPIARSTRFASDPNPGRPQDIVLNRLHSHPSDTLDS